MKTEVLFHSGYRRSVQPRALVIDGEECLVESIIRREVIEDVTTRARKQRFICSVKGKLWQVELLGDGSTLCRILG
jgi:hypothetical protein